jgi:hypothetical protein
VEKCSSAKSEEMMTYDGDDPRFICKTLLAFFFPFISCSDVNPIKSKII